MRGCSVSLGLDGDRGASGLAHYVTLRLAGAARLQTLLNISTC